MGRASFSHLILKPLDFALDVDLPLREGASSPHRDFHLRFQRFKLRVERDHLRSLLLGKRDILFSKKSETRPHESPPKV